MAAVGGHAADDDGSRRPDGFGAPMLLRCWLPYANLSKRQLSQGHDELSVRPGRLETSDTYRQGRGKAVQESRQRIERRADPVERRNLEEVLHVLNAGNHKDAQDERTNILLADDPQDVQPDKPNSRAHRPRKLSPRHVKRSEPHGNDQYWRDKALRDRVKAKDPTLTQEELARWENEVEPRIKRQNKQHVAYRRKEYQRYLLLERLYKENRASKLLREYFEQTVGPKLEAEREKMRKFSRREYAKKKKKESSEKQEPSEEKESSAKEKSTEPKKSSEKKGSSKKKAATDPEVQPTPRRQENGDPSASQMEFSSPNPPDHTDARPVMVDGAAAWVHRVGDALIRATEVRPQPGGALPPYGGPVAAARRVVVVGKR